MPEKDPNLEENVDVSELSSLSLDDETLNDIDEALGAESTDETVGTMNISDVSDFETSDQVSSSIDESVFLDSWDNAMARKNVLKDDDNFWVYLRRFFFSAILTLIGILAIALFYSFSTYLTEATKPTPDSDYVSYVETYKEKFKKVKELIGISSPYESPDTRSSNQSIDVNTIINATDIDYIEKKDLLSKYVLNLTSEAQNRAQDAENLKQDIAKQWFLPEELGVLLLEDQAIDTIQRSLNALEVIKFSTATKVFSYMNTALNTISEMIRNSWATTENLRNLFVQIGSRWEKDISSYVYMCYLNPFEINANCDIVGDLDLYYNITKDNSIDIRLFKNSMNAISQLLEKEDTSLFSITFNWFDAQEKSIEFTIEVYTNQEDEKSLMQQWKRNPNIFILTNIINLLKQSSFIIWAEINTKEMNVETKLIEQGNFTRKVNYSTMDFIVPIQKDTEREIFDYIDLDSMKKLLSDRWFEQSVENVDENLDDHLEDNEIEENVEQVDEAENIDEWMIQEDDSDLIGEEENVDNETEQVEEDIDL